MRMAASALSLWWALARTMAIPISAQHRLLMCGRARRGLSTPSSLYLEAAPLRDNLSMNRCRSGEISPKAPTAHPCTLPNDHNLRDAGPSLSCPPNVSNLLSFSTQSRFTQSARCLTESNLKPFVNLNLPYQFGP